MGSVGLLSEAESVGEWMNNVFEVAPSSKLALVGPEFWAWLNNTFDPLTRRNKFAGNSRQRRKIRRYQDRMFKRIGSSGSNKPIQTFTWWDR